MLWRNAPPHKRQKCLELIEFLALMCSIQPSNSGLRIVYKYVFPKLKYYKILNYGCLLHENDTICKTYSDFETQPGMSFYSELSEAGKLKSCFPVLCGILSAPSSLISQLIPVIS